MIVILHPIIESIAINQKDKYFFVPEHDYLI